MNRAMTSVNEYGYDFYEGQFSPMKMVMITVLLIVTQYVVF